jgi:hypothetical protein
VDKGKDGMERRRISKPLLVYESLQRARAGLELNQVAAPMNALLLHPHKF